MQCWNLFMLHMRVKTEVHIAGVSYSALSVLLSGTKLSSNCLWNLSHKQWPTLTGETCSSYNTWCLKVYFTVSATLISRAYTAQKNDSTTNKWQSYTLNCGNKVIFIIFFTITELVYLWCEPAHRLINICFQVWNWQEN